MCVASSCPTLHPKPASPGKRVGAHANHECSHRVLRTASLSTRPPILCHVGAGFADVTKINTHIRFDPNDQSNSCSVAQLRPQRAPRQVDPLWASFLDVPRHPSSGFAGGRGVRLPSRSLRGSPTGHSPTTNAAQRRSRAMWWGVLGTWPEIGHHRRGTPDFGRRLLGSPSGPVTALVKCSDPMCYVDAATARGEARKRALLRRLAIVHPIRQPHGLPISLPWLTIYSA